MREQQRLHEQSLPSTQGESSRTIKIRFADAAEKEMAIKIAKSKGRGSLNNYLLWLFHQDVRKEGEGEK